MKVVRDTLSAKALDPDRLQEQLVGQRQRVFQVTSTLVVLVEIGLWFWGAATWIMIVVPLFWLGLVIHNATLCILHELWEINDQLSGRKAEFRSLISRRKL